MENVTNDSNSIKIEEDTQFFGKVPRALELAFVGICLGAPIQYRKDKITGQTSACLLIPSENGYQPTVLTFSKEDMVGTSQYDAIYHQLGVDEIIKSTNEGKTNEKVAGLLVEKFAQKSNLGIENGYMDNFYNDKVVGFSEAVVKEIYPEYNNRFEDALGDYKNSFEERFSGKKKQITPTQMTTNK